MRLIRRDPFLRACALGDLEEVGRMLNAGEGIEQTDQDGATAVHIAILNRNLPLLRLLAEKKPPPDFTRSFTNTRGQTFLPVELAIRNGFLEGLKFLVEEQHVPLASARYTQRDMLLFHALRQPNCILMLQYLVEKQGLSPASAVFSNGHTIMHAVEEKDCHYAVAEYLLKHHGNCRTVSREVPGEKEPDHERNRGALYDGYPLTMAAWKGDPERVALYLRHGASPLQKNRHGKDAMDAAQDKRSPDREEHEEDYAEIQDILSNAAEEKPIPDSRENPFVAACARNDVEEVYRRLKKGESPNQLDSEGMAGIHVAIKAHNFELFELLVHFDANPHQHIGGDESDLTAVELAIEEGFLDGLKHLDEKGVQLVARTGRPLEELLFHALMRKDNILTLRWLVEDKILDPRDAIARDGLDILSESEGNDRYLTYTEYLLQAGMDPREEAPVRTRSYYLPDIEIPGHESGPNKGKYASLPLVRACYAIEPDLADLYLDYGADPLAWNRHNNSPWDAITDPTNPHLAKNKDDVWTVKDIIIKTAAKMAENPPPPKPATGFYIPPP
jgi:ankyrin repeat protein